MSTPDGPLAFLLGAWRGSGRGHYPTIEDFTYEEEVTFASNGKPFLIYRQATKSPEGNPMHGEAGYLRPAPNGRAEFVLAHPFGVIEICEGSLENGRLDLSSTTVAGTSTAKEILATRRVIEVDGDELHYDFYMAAVGQPIQHHLDGTLTRV